MDLEHEMILSGPTIKSVGMAEEDSVFAEIEQDVRDALATALEDPEADTYSCQQAMRRVIGRWVGRKLRRRPMIVPVVVEQ